MPSLTRSEARRRAALLSVTRHGGGPRPRQGEHTFGSTTTISLQVRRAGRDDVPRPQAGRADLRHPQRRARSTPPASTTAGSSSSGLAADNVVVAEATMAYSRDGQGLHRAVDPADGEHYVYGHLFLDAAPTRVRLLRPARPQGARTPCPSPPRRTGRLGNGAATQVAPGALGAGDDPAAGDLLRHGLRRPLRLRARRARRHPAGHPRPAPRSRSRSSGEADADARGHPRRASTTTTGCSASGTRSASTTRSFVPEFNAGAMENPGCVTFRDTVRLPGRRRPRRGADRAPTPSPTRWRTCGSATS